MDNIMTVKETATKEEHIRSFIIITLTYLLTHGFILVLTGTWWDEYTWAFASHETMWDVSLQLGKPSSYFLMRFIFDIPEPLARLLIFFCFYLGTLGLYYIYNQIPFVNTRCALMMTLLYTAIPANDVRVLRGIFPYTAGYLFFVLAFCVLIILQKRYDYKNVVLRGLVLLLFTCSFTLNSNLCFYAIPLLYILSYIIKNGQIKKAYLYLDFVILPVMYFILKIKLFPVYGVYEGYNEVTPQKMISGVFQTFCVCVERLKNIIRLWGIHRYTVVLPVIIVSFIIEMVLLCKRKHKGKGIKMSAYDISVKDRVALLLIGGMAIYMGAYAYVVIGQGESLTGTDGRSAILLGCGAAVMIYAVVLWIPYEWIRTTLCAVAIVCGILHFNWYYLSYQQDYYRQQDLVYELKSNRAVLEETKNILYLTTFEPKVATTRFYSLNANGAEAFGDQTHFIMNGKNDLKNLIDSSTDAIETFVHGGVDYRMAEYEVGRSTEIEAIIIYESDLSLKDTLFLKMKEIFNYSLFEEELYSEENLIVYTPGMAEFDEILEEYVGAM